MALPVRRLAVIILRSFIPLFRIAYRHQDEACRERRGLDLARLLDHSPRFPPIPAIFEPTTPAGSDTLFELFMRLLNFLVESFVGAFGITKPRPEQQRTVAFALGGFLLLFFVVLASLILWMLFGVRR
jgi:hypothetical protein